MADVEEQPQQLSIQARIAALKLDQVGKNPSPSKQPPPLPNKPPANRAASAVVLSTIGDSIGNEPNGDSLPPLPTRRVKPPPPSLPPRRESGTPSLPPRRPSELNKKGSQESVSSVLSSVSGISNVTTRTGQSRPSMDNGRIRAPVYDPSTLPPLPPSKRAQEETEKANARSASWKANGSKSPSNIETREISAPSTPSLPQRPSNPSNPALPSRPNSARTPTLPSRPDLANCAGLPVLPKRPEQPPVLPQRTQGKAIALPSRRLPPTIIPPIAVRSPDLPQRPQINGNGAPPPIPIGTRPDLNKLLATKPKMSASQSAVPQVRATSNGALPVERCLICRDFSAPDAHAAKFPRQNVPNLGWLAEQLTAPFPSQTDKARAIFVWLHHNIDYNVKDFFAGTVKGTTPAATIQTGMAVCEGYAGLFAALAASVGMEAVVVGGHGKGFGHADLKPGMPAPPKDFNHAWNAVKIDHGVWKVIDPCWGAGHLNQEHKYERAFHPVQFTASNNQIGSKHFPKDSRHWYREDGRTPTWEEYSFDDSGIEPPWVFVDSEKEGFDRARFLPKQHEVSLNPMAHTEATVRFQWQRRCAHWDPLHHGPGKPYLYFLESRWMDPNDHSNFKQERFFVENDGFFWWSDISIDRLGKPGWSLLIAAVTKIEEQDGRGLTRAEYENRTAGGRWCNISWKYYAEWKVVA